MFPDYDRLQKLPLYAKALQIVEITNMLTEAFYEDKDQLNIAEQMKLNAHSIPAKIAGAEAGDLYSLRMESATMIKIAARELNAQTTLCKHMQLANKDYLQLLRDEIDQFRILYLQWVRSFDPNNDAPDEWTA